MTHICHERGQTHARCLVEVYRLYLGFFDFPCKMDKAFYFRPKKNRLGFDNVPVGINTLNQILPNMCSVAGIRKKTAHCLRVTCATSLFNAGVDEKLFVNAQVIVQTLFFSMRKLTENKFGQGKSQKLKYSR